MCVPENVVGCRDFVHITPIDSAEDTFIPCDYCGNDSLATHFIRRLNASCNFLTVSCCDLCTDDWYEIADGGNKLVV